MTWIYLISAPLLAALLSFLLTPVVRLLAIRVGAVDAPGPRKIHSATIPRLGGLAVVASCAIVTILLVSWELPQIHRIADNLVLGLTLGLMVVLIASIIDDITPLGAAPKFAAQFLGASLAVGFGIRLGPEVHIFGSALTLGWLSVPISLLWIVGITNAFNIVDGLDGLSAGLALMSAISLAAGSVMVDQPGVTLLALVLAGALVGFLPYNVYPAKIFLGDSGATAIGFGLACLALRGGSTLSSGLAVIVPVLVLGVPISETLVSMTRRAVRSMRTGGRAALFEADAGHFHHRLLALGFDQRRAVLILYGAGLLLSLVGFGSLLLSQKKAAVLLLTMLGVAFVGLSHLGYEEFAVLRRGDLLRLYDVPVLRKGLFVVFGDMAIVLASIYGGFALKYDDWSLASHRPGATWLLAVFPPISLMAFYRFGLYRRMWRFAGVADLTRVSAAVTLAAGVTAVLSQLLNSATPPVTWFVIYYLLNLLGIIGSRASYRLLEDFWKRSEVQGQAVLIYGASRSGAMVLREMLSNRDLNMRPIGFIDDDPTLTGRVFGGYPVVGPMASLEASIVQFQVRGLVVATPKLSVDRLSETAAVCERSGIWMKRFSLNFHDGDGSLPAPPEPTGRAGEEPVRPSASEFGP